MILRLWGTNLTRQSKWRWQFSFLSVPSEKRGFGLMPLRSYNYNSMMIYQLLTSIVIPGFTFYCAYLVSIICGIFLLPGSSSAKFNKPHLRYISRWSPKCILAIKMIMMMALVVMVKVTLLVMMMMMIRIPIEQPFYHCHWQKKQRHCFPTCLSSCMIVLWYITR